MAGNQRKSAANKAAAGQAVTQGLRLPISRKDLPRAPTALGHAGRAAWRKIGRDLCDRGSLTVGDLSALQTLAEQFDVSARCQECLEREGVLLTNDKGNYHQNPAVTLMQTSSRIKVQLYKEFGLTPSSSSGAPMAPLSESGESDESKAADIIDGPGLRAVR